MQQDLFHKYVLFNMYYLFINICGVATVGPDAVLSAGDKMVSKASPDFPGLQSSEGETHSNHSQ